MTGQSFAALSLYALTGAGLIGLGTYGLIAVRHLLRRVIAFNLIGSGLFLFFGAVAARVSTAETKPATWRCKSRPVAGH